MKKLELEDLLETLEKRSSKEWNEAIASRIKAVENALHQDAWTKGIGQFLRAVQGHAILRILNEQSTADQVNFLRGFAAGLQVAISLPASVSAQIEKQDTGPQGVPEGGAGY
jgi:hypothetical protein